MIADAISVATGSLLDCDFCIIGGGPAGIAMTLELARAPLQIILLETGSWKEGAAARDLLRGLVTPAGSHEPLEDNRRRQFGGSSAGWGGRLIPFDAIDFEKRPWMPDSGWPLSARELEGYYARATELCEAGRPIYDARAAGLTDCHEMIKGFDGEEVTTCGLERWSPPTNFAKRYGPDLARSSRVRTFLNAAAMSLELGSGFRDVVAVRVASGGSERFTVRARYFILACGGLETARLLLASNAQLPAGIGNDRDNVGRYYMSHLQGSQAFVSLRDTDRGLIYGFEKDGKVYVRRRFWISETAQRRARIGNATAFLQSPFQSELSNGTALPSVVYLAKFATGLRRQGGHEAMQRLRDNRQQLLKHLKAVMRGVPGLIPQVANAFNQRYISKRRLPILLPRREDIGNRFEIYYQTEHAPNRDSRVVLHGERDALGMPRLEVRIAFSEIDVMTVLETHRIIARRFEQSGTGKLIYDEACLEAAVRSQLRQFNSGAHHAGTTRMADDAAAGVVNRNCTVHGISNLHVAGSSVFATSSHANPTLTLLALALRLADFLKTNAEGA